MEKVKAVYTKINDVIKAYCNKKRVLSLLDWVKTNKLKTIIYCGAASLLFVLSQIILIYLGAFGHLPTTLELKNVKNPIASSIIGSNNQVIDYFYIQNRSNIDSTEIAPHFLEALIATEDVRFYQHSGIDYRSLGRVLVKSILMQNKRSGGGSTITQQLAKNLYGRKKHFLFSSPINKIREMIIARRMEHVYSKTDILILYLNTVSFGENLYGIEKAAYRFYNKKPKNLSLDESAVLVGVLKAPSYYNPRSNPETSLIRRNVVLSQMAKYNFITPEEFERATQKEIKLNYQLLKVDAGSTAFYKDYLRTEFDAWAADNPRSDGSIYNLDTDGLKIYTTVHPAIQHSAEKALIGHISRLQPIFRRNNWDAKSFPGGRDSLLVHLMLQHPTVKKRIEKGEPISEIIESYNLTNEYDLWSIEGNRQGVFSRRDSIIHFLTTLNGSIVAIHPQTGGILAYTGGVDYGYSQYDQVKIPRQVGSTFKPIVYLAALENGTDACEFYDNTLISYPEYESWTPRNSDGEYGGAYSVHGALAQSVNTVAVQIMLKTGVKKVVNLARKMGISSKLEAVPSLVLGTSEISLLDMVKAFCGIANGGNRVDTYSIRKIEDENGKVLMQQGGKVEGTFANSDHIITIQKMLNEVTQNGTGAAMKYYSSGYNVIGKTGTTQNQSDGWYIGALPEVCVGAWVGTLDKRIHFKSLGLGSGANTALPIVGRVFADLALWRTPIITNFSWDKEKFDCPEYQNSTAEEAMKRIYSDSSNIESFVPVSEEGKIDSLLIPLEKDSLQ